jgi:hypothetical protein
MTGQAFPLEYTSPLFLISRTYTSQISLIFDAKADKSQ